MAKFYDTLLGEYIKNPGARGLSLDKLAARDFEYEMISYDDVTMKGKMSFDEVELDRAAVYSAEDVYVTSLLYMSQLKDHFLTPEKNSKSHDILHDMEIPLMSVLVDMELSGVKVDRDRLKGIGTILENEIAYLEKDIFHDADMEFNINSPKQVGEVLFDELQLPKGKKTKTGWSVSADVLQSLAFDYPIAQKIVDYRHYSKLLSTYIDGLTKLLDENDLVHTSYNQAVTTTGRLSSTKPNLQNIPSGDGIAGQIREAFISRWDNGKIIAFDYSQVEVRLLAFMSGDENLLDAFNRGLDIHHRTAEFIFTKGSITGSQRKIAKAVNFGVIYGISAFGLSKMIGIGQKDAKVYIDKFYENYPKVREFFDNVIRDCEINGYVETIFGRRRYINSINDKNSLIKKAAEREAINMPIQGTSADILKIAMIKIHELMSSKNMKTKMIMQVHDELVFDVYDGEEDELSKIVFEVMENVIQQATIELKVDKGGGKTWSDAK